MQELPMTEWECLLQTTAQDYNVCGTQILTSDQEIQPIRDLYREEQSGGELYI